MTDRRELRPVRWAGTRGVRGVERRIAILALVCCVSPAIATTYYVDPRSGCSDANPGTASGAPWCTPPGTVNVANSGWLHASWGSITTSNKIQCGDTILLKGGSTQTSAQGGGWAIRNGWRGDGVGFYTANCAPDSPITFKVATSAQWPGSTGHFTLDGTGMARVCLTIGAAFPGFAPCGTGGPDSYLVGIEDLDSIVFGGASETQRLRILNSPNNGIELYGSDGGGNSCGTDTGQHIIAEYLEVANSAENGAAVACMNNSVVRRSVFHNNQDGGVATGFSFDYRNQNFGFEDIETYENNDCTSTSFVGAESFFLGCTSCYLVRSKHHDGCDRGLNMGEVGSGAEFRLLVRDAEFWQNGRSSNNLTGVQSGPCTSGDDSPGGNQQRTIFERSIIYRNEEIGGPCAYGQGWAEVWNSVFYGNGWDPTTFGRCDIAYAIDTDRVGIYNTIAQKSPANTGIYCDGAPHGSASSGACPTGDYNLFRPDSSDTEALASGGGNCGTGGGTTFANPPGFVGAHSKVGTAFPINFVALDPTVYANNDFHITSGSAAIDAGTCFFRAGNTSSGTTISSLSAGGGATDPRLYFIEPASYKGAVGDTINIGSDQVTITSMTATSISFTPSTSWATNDCIHLAYTGSAPDLGVFELGATAPPPGQIAPPRLLSVDPM
jgi:hypothetical protein